MEQVKKNIKKLEAIIIAISSSKSLAGLISRFGRSKLPVVRMYHSQHLF